MSNRLLLAALVFVCCPFALIGQSANQGIRIELDQDGLYEIAWNDLAPYFKVSSLDAERMRVMRGNLEIPISFRSLNGGRFDRSSALIFYGEANPNHHSDLGVYRLELKPGRKRIRLYRPRSTEETLEECSLSQTFEENLIYKGMRTVRTDLLDLPRGQRIHWIWAEIPPATNTPGTPSQNFHSFLLRPSPRPRPVDNLPAKLTINLRAPLVPGVKQEMVCELGGQLVGRKSWTATNKVQITFDVPSRLIKAATVLTLRNVSSTLTWSNPSNQVNPQQSNNLLVDSISIRHESLLTGATTKQPQIIYDLDVPKSSSTISLKFVNTSGQRSRFYDVNRNSWLEGTVIDCTPNKKRRIIAVKTDGYLKPKELSKWSRRNLRLEQKGAEWVCISLERFAGYMAPLKQLRQEQGLSTMIVSDREIYDSYNHGVFSPDAIKKFLSTAHSLWKVKPKYVLLVGDADRDVNWISRRRVLPTMQTMTYFNGTTASDSAFLPDGVTSMSIGRFPARRKDEVHKMVRRCVDYESKPKPGPWMRRLNFVASTGRFGPAVDALIEGYARGVLTKEIPASYDVTMTYANPTSPYLYPPAEFNHQVISRFNEGALVFSYMGHGYARGFDQLRIGKKRYPILDVNDVTKIDAADMAPLMTVIACSTAHFDNPKLDCIGEQLMRRLNGPIGFIGATRISHPFANSLLSKELIKGIFAQNQKTIGEVLQDAKIRLLKNWAKDPITKMAKGLVGKLNTQRLMEDHCDMYVLFGDPATKLNQPQQSVHLECASEADQGALLQISGRLEEPQGQAILLTVAARRDRIIFPVAKFKNQEEVTSSAIKQNYNAANHKVVATATATIINGAFSTAIQLPKDIPPGAYVVQAFCLGDRRSFAGAKRITLK